MIDTSRKTRNGARRITIEETQAALDALVESMGADRISPMPAINGSANGLLEVMLGITCSRAAYILDLLVKSGAVSRIEKSHKVVVTRATVQLEHLPALSVSDKDRYEATIRLLHSLLAAEQDRTTQLTAQVEDLQRQLDELIKTGGPSMDVAEIMAGVGVV